LLAAIVIALLVVVGAVVWMTLDTPEQNADPTIVGGTATQADEGDASAPRRHVGATADEPVEEEVVDPDEPVTREQRLQWIREWLEIACGNGYAWKDRMEAQRAVLTFDEAESVPLILELAKIDDVEAGYWGWAMQLLGTMGPRAKAAIPDLVELLRKDEDRGFAAASALGRIGSISAPHVLPMLEDDQPDEVRKRALGAVSMYRRTSREIVLAILPLLEHEDADMRAQAAGALWNSGAHADLVVPAMIDTLSDEDEDVRFAAVLALYRLGPKAAPAVAALGIALRDENESVGDWAATALGQVGPEARSQTDTLVTLLVDDPQRWKDSAPEALLGLGTRALLHVMSKDSAAVHIAVIPMIPEGVADDSTTADAAVTALGTALTSADASVREAAANALGELGPTASAAVPRLLSGAADSEPRVQRASLIAAARVGGPRDDVLKVLTGRLAEGSDAARESAAEALASLGPDAAIAVDALTAALSDRSVMVRAHAARALEEIGPEAITAASALGGRLADDAPKVRLAAAIALIAIDPPGIAARETIDKLRIHDRETIRRSLVIGLGRRAHPDWIGVVANRLDDRDQGVRAAAARALGRFGEPARPHVPALAERLRREKIHGVQLALLDALGMLGPIAIDAVDTVAWAQTVPHLRDAANAAMEKIR
jgi:HEAT repeat protein